MKANEILLAGSVAMAQADAATNPDPSASLHEWIQKIKSADDAVRGPAWQKAVQFGVPAIEELGQLMADPDFEIARCAKRALWLIVRHSGRPKADQERKAAVKKLLSLLSSSKVPVQREILWMLSEIGDDSSVDGIKSFLTHNELREDARCVLDRIPGSKSTGALRTAFKSAPEDFRSNLAHSLRLRGEKVEGYPSQKLIPNKKTSVAPAGSA